MITLLQTVKELLSEVKSQQLLFMSKTKDVLPVPLLLATPEKILRERMSVNSHCVEEKMNHGEL